MKTILSVALLVVLFWVYFWGAGKQATEENTDMRAMDQSAYMDYARKMHDTDYAFVGGRDRMPIYPFIMSLFYDNEMDDDEFFEIGKKVNFLISVVVLLCCFFIFRLYAGGFEAGTATSVVAFTVFAYKAPYFQVEILFYGVTLVVFVLMLEMLRKPRVRSAIVAGLAAGIGHLTKASVIPSVTLATFCLVYSAIARHFSDAPEKDSPTDVPAASGRSAVLREFVYPIIFVVSFLAVIFPYIYTSNQVFGQYFYNVSSTFYMWYDSWGEAKRGTRAHGDRVGWPDLPEEEIPSMRKYFEDHDLQEVAERISDGLATVWEKTTQSYGYMLFLLFYALACMALLWTNKPIFMRLISDSRIHRLSLFFIAAYFCGYLLLYAWYVPIGPGNRFALALMLPLMFLFVRFLAFSRANDLSFSLWGRRVHSSAVAPMVSILLASYLVVLFPDLVSSMYGGT